MPRDLVCGFEIGLQNCFVDIATAFVPAGIYVHRNQRFRFVDHNVAAAAQPNLAMKRVVDLFLDSERFKNRRRAVVEFQTVPSSPRNFFDQLVHPFQCFAIVTKHLVNFLGQKIAHRSLDQVRFFKNATGRRFVANQPFDFGPLIEQETQIAHEISRPLAFADGANNYADAFRNVEVAQNFPEAVAFLRVLDFARNSAPIAERH